MRNENEIYWESRYQNNNTGWDMKFVSPPLKSYFDQLEDKNIKILIPGAGNAYEAEYLYQIGFKHVYVADIAKTPLINLKTRFPNFPKNQLLHKDFFDLEDNFDYIIEQTFFCAIPPKQRYEYAKKSHQLLKTNGKLIGVFFDFPLTNIGPPYGGNIKEYEMYFKNLFELKILEPCHNSHPKRHGKELFFSFLKKNNHIKPITNT